MTDEEPQFYRDFFPDKDAATPHPIIGPFIAPLPPGATHPYAEAAFNAEVEELARTPNGHRNHQLNVAAFNLSQFVASGLLDRTRVWDGLHTTARAIGLEEGETLATLRSAFGAGTLLPRVVADLDHDAVPEVTVLGDVPQLDTEDAPPTLRDRFPALNWWDLWADQTEDEWVLYPLLPARRLVALFSAPKVGKSLLMLELAVGISNATEVLGTIPDRARRVLYIDHENDPRGDVRTRLMAMGHTPDVLDNLLYLSYPNLAYLDTYIGGQELLALTKEYAVEVVMVDTISRAVSGEENDNDTWLGFYRNTGKVMKAAGVALLRLDHTGKDEAKGMRGGSAKYGDVDAAWSMRKLSEDRFHLECVANRLPIAEKDLTLRRELGPLRHTVDLAGRRAAFDQQAARALLLIEGMQPPVRRKGPHAAQPPRGTGYTTLYPLLHKLDPTLTRNEVRAAVRKYHGMVDADHPDQTRLGYDPSDDREDP